MYVGNVMGPCPHPSTLALITFVQWEEWLVKGGAFYPDPALMTSEIIKWKSLYLHVKGGSFFT